MSLQLQQRFILEVTCYRSFHRFWRVGGPHLCNFVPYRLCKKVNITLEQATKAQSGGGG